MSVAGSSTEIGVAGAAASAAVTVWVMGVLPSMLTVITSPATAPAGSVTSTGTPSAASVALMPPAASGTLTVGAAGGATVSMSTAVVTGAAALPAASA
jgi:hypothetical protein